jgi:hypothetical protein
MIVRVTLSLFASAAILAASGCCNPHVYRGCGDACYPTPCAPCGPAVATCEPAAPCGDCGTCDPSPCGCGSCRGWYPGKRLVQWLTCGTGCGGVYVNEWISDPPDCCDPCEPCGTPVGPCDPCGTHVDPCDPCGPQSCVPFHAKFWHYLVGQRCQEPYLPTVEFVPGCGASCCGPPDCCGDCGGGMPMMAEELPKGMEPVPRFVPGSPAEVESEAVPVPDPAPTGKVTAKTAYGTKKRRGAYYPYGRVRSH